jgi:hypothetical protein
MTASRGATGTPKELSYGFDAHGSVSLLLDSTGQAKAAYGYQAYGDLIAPLTSEHDRDTISLSAPPPPEHLPLARNVRILTRLP